MRTLMSHGQPFTLSLAVISLLHCENHGCFLEISGKSIKQAANWLVSVHVRSLRTHFPLNGVTGSEFIALRMRKCAQSANVSSQTSSKKKIRPGRWQVCKWRWTESTTTPLCYQATVYTTRLQIHR